MFEENEYVKLTNQLQNTVTTAYAIIMIIAVIIGIAGGGVALIITIPIGLLISKYYTLNTRIKIQEMKWKIDMYEKNIKGSN